MPGTLFVVATPIGNLEDLTFRALRTLREVDLIAAEDTRRTSRLLAHYDIRKPLVSLHEHNEHQETPRLVERLAQGSSIALVSDAGTPGIADPGAGLVSAAHAQGLKVVPIPGPSAVAAALSVSGFSADEFTFMGFPPRSGAARADWLARFAESPGVVVFFEAPHRIRRTLEEVEASGVRPIIVNRELTKINEEVVIRPNSDSIVRSRELGEFVVVAGPRLLSEQDASIDSTAASVFDRLTESAMFPEHEAIRMTAAHLSVKESVVKKALKRRGIERNQARQPRP
jgi:16S rRNA (cytidine1402-2'-O)-methyltransferase